MKVLHARLRSEAEAVLRRNDRGRHTVPAAGLYPHQWAWDSAFAAIGWSWLDPDRAVTELEQLMARAWPDGRVAHIAFDPSADGYWPDPSFWGTGERGTSSISQPPLWATAALLVAERGGDLSRIAALLDRIEASHTFFRTQRDPLGLDLVAVAHPWESGMDNSPAWDFSLGAIDPTRAPEFQRQDLKKGEAIEQRPTDDDYKRYAVIVKDIEAAGFGIGPFRVYDPGMSALLGKAEAALAQLFERTGQSERANAARGRATAISAALVQHLWSQPAGRFAFLDASSGRSYTPEVVNAWMPAIVPLPDAILVKMVSKFRTMLDAPCPIPTTALTSPQFDRRRYWRGPSWINVNWLLEPVWGREIAQRSLRMIASQGFREYFDPISGEGLGARDFTWTAALCLDWLERGHSPD